MTSEDLRRMRLHDFNTDFTWEPTSGPFRLITAAQARAYDEDGFFVLESALDASTLKQLTDGIDPIEAAEEEYLRTKMGGRHLIARADEITFTTHLASKVPAVRELVVSRIFQDLCHDLIGPDARLYWEMAVYKKPGTVEPFPWHQDNGYTFVTPQEYLTCWIALNDATLQNGCPWVVPGMHRVGTLAHRATRIGLVCLDGEPDNKIAVPVRAGSIVVMSSLSPHATGPNLSAGVRKAIVAEFIPAGAATMRRTEAGDMIRTPCDTPRHLWVLQNGQPPAQDPVPADASADTRHAAAS